MCIISIYLGDVEFGEGKIEKEVERFDYVSIDVGGILCVLFRDIIVDGYLFFDGKVRCLRFYIIFLKRYDF